MGGLSGLHTYFTSNNTTTYEHFRARYSSHGNPYDLGFLRNWRSVHHPTLHRPTLTLFTHTLHACGRACAPRLPAAHASEA